MKNAELEMVEDQLSHGLSIYSGSQSPQKTNRKIKESVYKYYIKSLITFNNGGDWRLIRAP